MTSPPSARASGSCPASAPASCRWTTASWLPGLAFLEPLPDAQDRPQPGIDRASELAPDELVGLEGVAAPLGVADDDPCREADEHRRRDLAGVRALQLVMDVLGPDTDVGIRRRRARRARRPG